MIPAQLTLIDQSLTNASGCWPLSKTIAAVATLLLRTVLHLTISERPVLPRYLDQIDDHVLLA